MSYRIEHHHHPHPERSAQDTATPSHLYAHNGTTARFAFPCWYQEVHPPIRAHHHNYHLHDYQGWPSPTHPDHICQLWSPDRHCCSIGEHNECSPHCRHYLDMRTITPIHLLEEGYTEVTIAWIHEMVDEEGNHYETSDTTPPDGITAVGYIDIDDDWVVRAEFAIKDPTALHHPKRYRISVSAVDHNRNVSDIIVLAELVVLPAAYA